MNRGETSILLSGLVLAFAAAGQAAHRDIPTSRHQQAQTVVVTVDLIGGSQPSSAMMQEAELIAGRIFSWIGIRLVWHPAAAPQIAPVCVPACPQIEIQLDAGTPGGLDPRALAYAIPYASSGTRIHVLWNRLSRQCPREICGQALGHVLAHEMTHVLQGVAQHSERGLMKARWDATDFHIMAAQPLTLTAEDVDLVRRGMAESAKTSAGTLPPPVPRH